MLVPACCPQLSRYTQPHCHALTPRAARLKESRSTMFVSCPKTFTLHRAMSYVTPHLTTPSTCTPSLSSTLSSSHVLHPPLSENKPCGDPRPHLSGALAEPRPFTGSLSPSSLLRTRITGISPKTSSLLNTRIYMSNPCSSTTRA